MSKRLSGFIQKYNIISNQQFGFRTCHTTLHAILSITDHIQRAIEEGKLTCDIFLDLRKAFDFVSHQTLIKKLDHYGIRRAVKNWFISYLQDRKHLLNFAPLLQTFRRSLVECLKALSSSPFSFYCT